MAKKIPMLRKPRLDTLDHLELLDMERWGLTIEDLLDGLADLQSWGVHGQPLDPKLEGKMPEEPQVDFTQEELGLGDPEDDMTMEQIFALKGEEDAAGYLIEKYQNPDELDELYEFDLEDQFPTGLHVIVLDGFIFVFCLDKLQPYDEDGTRLLQGFRLDLLSTKAEFATTFSQSRPS